MSNKIVIKNREPQEIKISGGGEVLGITAVYVNGIDVTEGNVAYVIVPTKLSELQNNMGFITEEVDPTVPYYVKQITQADINKWNNKQDTLVSGTNIKTINDNSIMGSGNLVIDTSYTAGTGIEITEENVINNTITSYDDLTDLPTIPTKTSDILNDSGYVTSDDLSEVAFTGSYVSLSNTPTVVSDFINDANYIDMNFIWNMLPKLTDTDSTINLNPTVLNAPLKIELNPNTSQESTPTPDYPQDIHVVSGDNTVKVIGQNIWDEEWEQGYYNSTGGKETDTNAIRSKNFIQVQPNTTYYIYNGTDSNGRINYYDKDKTFISTTTSQNTTKTTPNNCYYILFSTGTSYGGTYLHNICINVSNANVNGTYEPHEEQVVNIPLGDLEYCKIPNTNYEDEFYLATSSDTGLTAGKWYLKKNIRHISLNISDMNNSENYPGWQNMTQFKDDYPNVNNTFNALGIFAISNIVNSSIGFLGNTRASGANGILILNKSYFNLTQTDWQTNYPNLIVELYYNLQSPEYTLLNDTLQNALNTLKDKLLAYKDQTNISQVNDDLPFQITAETVKSLVNE